MATTAVLENHQQQLASSDQKQHSKDEVQRCAEVTVGVGPLKRMTE